MQSYHSKIPCLSSFGYPTMNIAAKTKLILNSFVYWTINHKYREGIINHNVSKWAFLCNLESNIPIWAIPPIGV